jgi:hypothetical protein
LNAQIIAKSFLSSGRAANLAKLNELASSKVMVTLALLAKSALFTFYLPAGKDSLHSKSLAPQMAERPANEVELKQFYPTACCVFR